MKLRLSLQTRYAQKPVSLPSTPTNRTPTKPASYIVSPQQMIHWIANTDAELTFVGKPPNSLALRSPQDTVVVYCSTRNGNTCSPPCTVYNGGPICLAAPNTNCLSATNDIGFCNQPGCTGNCTFLTGCILQLDDGFCWTPNTESILVSTA